MGRCGDGEDDSEDLAASKSCWVLKLSKPTVTRTFRQWELTYDSHYCCAPLPSHPATFKIGCHLSVTKFAAIVLTSAALAKLNKHMEWAQMGFRATGCTVGWRVRRRRGRGSDSLHRWSVELALPTLGWRSSDLVGSTTVVHHVDIGLV